MSVALVCAIAFSAAACGKKNNSADDGSGIGMQEPSRRGQKITSDSPWYESTSSTFKPELDKSRKAQYVYSSLVGADDKYVVVYSSGNYQLPEDFDWSKYSSKEVEVALVTVVDRSTMKVAATIDLTNNYGISSYSNGITYDEGKIKAVITDYDSVNDTSVNNEISFDPATGKELETKKIERGNNSGRSYKVGDYRIDTVLNWEAQEYYTLIINSPDGNQSTVDIKKDGKNVYDLPAILPLEGDKALVPASIEREQCFFELDLKSGALTEKDAKDYDWISTNYLYSAMTGRDGMIYYTTPVGVARIDMKNKKTDPVFNYSW